MEEVWREISLYPNYEISNFGNVRNKKTLLNIKQSLSGKYKTVGIINFENNRKTVLVHRIVAITFIENIDNKKTVNHIDLNTLNNHVSNLEWATMKEQNQHKFKLKNNKDNHNSGKRKIWRLSQENKDKLELFDSITDAAKWAYNNNLTNEKILDEKAFKNISKNIKRSFKNRVIYNHYWLFDDNEIVLTEDWYPISPHLISNNEGYSISKTGKIKNKYNRITEGYLEPTGYKRIHIGDKLYRINRLMALVFLKNPENKPMVNHIDGDKSNNKLDNLEWVTSSENQLHCINILGKKRN